MQTEAGGELLNIHAPIGLDIGGESPEELGISILAEIMAVRYGRTAMLCGTRNGFTNL